MIDKESELREALEEMCYQFADWSEGRGLWTGGKSAVKQAFAALDWDDPHPCPELLCDEPGCGKQATCGFPAAKNEIHPRGYRRTCGDHWIRKGQRGDGHQ